MPPRLIMAKEQVCKNHNIFFLGCPFCPVNTPPKSSIFTSHVLHSSFRNNLSQKWQPSCQQSFFLESFWEPCRAPQWLRAVGAPQAYVAASKATVAPAMPTAVTVAKQVLVTQVVVLPGYLRC